MIKSPSALILSMPRLFKRAVALTVDFLLCVGTVAGAYLLRIDHVTFPVGSQRISYVAAVLFALPLFITFGLYRAIFRYVGWAALMSVVRACAVYGLIYASIFTAVGIVGVPRMIGILQPILLFLAVGTSRAFARYWLGGGYRHLMRLGTPRRVLIFGAGFAGRQLAAAISSSDQMQVVGFLDDDHALQGRVLNGKPIYRTDDPRELIERLDVADLLLAIPSASRQRRNQIIQSVQSTKATIRTLPGLMDLAHGRVTVNDLREVDIEDLLGRDQVPPDLKLLSRNIGGKTVMVTGAGGSIGSELSRQILTLKPKALLLFEQSEFNLYSIHQELERRVIEHGSDTVRVVPLLGSVQDAGRVRSIMSSSCPDTIYHAAAYKHVPLVEQNPVEGIRNNILGTLTMARLAHEFCVRDFVLVSTDKAVRPTNVMGATKRFSEQVLQALSARGSDTCFSMVRFGNVLGSSGSVVPLFKKQIKTGGPVTITHEEITRYFMTIPEAAELVLQAGAMAQGGEVFVLDMGSPVKIMDLAHRMIELSGLTVRDATNPDGDIAIEIIGLRPAEKLYEELLIGDNPTPTMHSRIMQAKEEFAVWDVLEDALTKLENAIDGNDVKCAREILRKIVREYDCSVEGGRLVGPIFAEEKII